MALTLAAIIDHYRSLDIYTRHKIGLGYDIDVIEESYHNYVLLYSAYIVDAMYAVNGIDLESESELVRLTAVALMRIDEDAGLARGIRLKITPLGG